MIPERRHVAAVMLRLGGLVICGMLGWGCAHGVCPAQPHTEPSKVLEYHAAMRRHVGAVRAEARVDRRGEEGRIHGTVWMFVQRPDRVRFDAMTQFGPAAVLTSDGERFALTDLREKRYLQGPTCPRNVARLVGIELSGRQTAMLLVGRTPILEDAENRLLCDAGVYEVRQVAPDGSRQVMRFEVRAQDLERPPEKQRLRLIESAHFDAAGRLAWRVHFDDYRVMPVDEKGVAMPFEIRFEQPRMGRDTRVRFEEINLNPEIPADVFTQQPRPGMQREEIRCE